MGDMQASELLKQKTGEMEFRLTNDYLFRIVFQENEVALKGLLAAVLHIRVDEITSVVIENPIKPGDGIGEKEYRMDILMTLNSNHRVDLEMQVENYYDWENRSLLYLSREYDKTLKHGDSYRDVTPIHQIGILDYTLFPDHPEFCGTYMMKNVSDGYIYNGNFKLTVVQLSQISEATEEDEEYGLVMWARLFKAATWEDLRMIAKNGEAMTVAANAAAYYESDENVRKRIEERNDFLRWSAYMKRQNEEYQKQIEDQAKLLSEQAERIKQLEEELEKK